jgi:F0F1-type ATP synthase assembly protein I
MTYTNFLQQNAVLDAEARLQLEAQAKLKKEAEDLKNQLDSVNSKSSAPAKSMTLIHIGLLVGGIVVGYYAFKMFKK